MVRRIVDKVMRLEENDWKSAPIRKGLYEEAERMAEKRHFPNVSQYINDAIRRALDEDAAKVAGSQGGQ